MPLKCFPVTCGVKCFLSRSVALAYESGMNIVFGSSGTVGSAVLDELLRQGSPCRAVYHSRKPQVPTETARVDLATGEGLVECLKGATSVFLATGDMRDQVAAEVRVVEAARHAGVQRIVKLSVLDAESEAFFHAKVHRAVEREIERAGLPFTHLRPTEFMQNFVYQYGASIREAGTFRLPCGDNLESSVDARDIGAVAAACLCSDRFVGQALDLCGPKAMRYSEMATVISRVTGRTVTFEPTSDEEFRSLMLPYAVSPEHVQGLIDLYHYPGRVGDPATGGAVLAVTGKRPRSFEDFAVENAHVWVS